MFLERFLHLETLSTAESQLLSSPLCVSPHFCSHGNLSAGRTAHCHTCQSDLWKSFVTQRERHSLDIQWVCYSAFIQQNALKLLWQHRAFSTLIHSFVTAMTSQEFATVKMLLNAREAAEVHGTDLRQLRITKLAYLPWLLVLHMFRSKIQNLLGGQKHAHLWTGSVLNQHGTDPLAQRSPLVPSCVIALCFP